MAKTKFGIGGKEHVSAKIATVVLIEAECFIFRANFY